jgi:hypothetical protein
MAVAVTVWACQVPVFRYALERWESGTYVIRAPTEMKVDPLANAEILQAAGATELELYYPSHLRQASEKPIWSAPATAENVRLMLDSPVRQELRKRLLSGQSAVWLLIESGNATKDAAALKIVEDGLKLSQGKLKLPDRVITHDEANDPAKRHENADVLQSNLPLKIEFSTLMLSRKSSAEAALIAMLMNIESDLSDYTREPMVFPVFGRGRALEPLIGSGIHADNIYQAAAYLCGACSCEIKEQNPGIDLLMTADWSVVGTDEGLPETVEINAETATPKTSKIWMLLTAGLLLVLAVALLRSKPA